MLYAPGKVENEDITCIEASFVPIWPCRYWLERGPCLHIGRAQLRRFHCNPRDSPSFGFVMLPLFPAK